ncbi:hypothetical protein N9043_00295 [bacterium]|nr:hypothetical protein [bacterium]
MAKFKVDDVVLVKDEGLGDVKVVGDDFVRVAQYGQSHNDRYGLDDVELIERIEKSPDQMEGFI